MDIVGSAEAWRAALDEAEEQFSPTVIAVHHDMAREEFVIRLSDGRIVRIDALAYRPPHCGEKWHGD